MAGYLGNTQKISGRYTVDEFTSSGGTTYTLGSAPGDKNNIQVSAGGLVQYPSAYSVSGTTLTLSGVPSGQKVVVRHMGDTIPFPLLDDNVVTSAKIASNSVTGAKIALGSDAAGDTMYYNGTDYARLAKGTTAQVLSMNAGATAPEWADSAGGGKILQCLHYTKTDRFTSSGTSWNDITNMTLTITPSATTSKVLILVHASICNTSTATDGCHVRLMRDSTPISVGTGSLGNRIAVSFEHNGDGNSRSATSGSIVYLDSPATTSATVYKLQGKVPAGGFGLNRITTDNNNVYTCYSTSSITVQEISV